VRRITIFDTTLRDGEQSPGIALRPAEKVEVARALERLRVDVIEAGFAASSPGDYQGVAAVSAAMSEVTVAALARTNDADVDAAAEALRSAPRRRIHVFIATSPIHMERKLRLRPEEVLEQISRGVERAAGKADEVQFSAEDAARSDRPFLAEACRRAVEAGAGVVNLPDTVGYTMPDEYAELIRDVRTLCPLLDDVDVSVHCHDDLGLAVANSLAGVAAGATQVECTVNGIGERAGNAALEEVVMALRVRPDFYDAETRVEPECIWPASALVARVTDYAVQPNKAIVGANAFAHEAGIHQDGLLKDVATYQIIDPAELGLSMTLPLGKHSGRHAFARACAEAGLELDREELNASFRRFKELADQGGTVTLDDVFEEVRR
jgi:2-isopropylmalate synthase